MDTTALRIWATHPTGNPVLQLLLELDISLNSKTESDARERTLLLRLLPGAPSSLKEPTSPASDFVSAMAYDPIGSRLLETLITHCPGKLFKALYKFTFGERIQSLVRNDIASYPAIRILSRLGKEDLASAINKIIPEVPKLVSLSRFNVLKTLFERCETRETGPERNALLTALISTCGPDPKALVPKLCIPQIEDASEKPVQQSLTKSQSALVSHGSQLTTTLLSIRGRPSNAVQTSLLSLPSEVLLNLATSSAPTAHVLTAALASPSQNKVFHKMLVVALMPHTMELAQSDHGSKVLSDIVNIPTKSDGINLPFHLKEQIMGQLGQQEQTLRDSYQGRRVWRTWKGDFWKTRRTEWIAWAKEVNSQPDKPVILPWMKKSNAVKGGNPNMVKIDDRAKKRKREAEALA
jgi:nucleolar protein 9